VSVYQVEEYYIYISGLSLTKDQSEQINKLLSDDGWSNYDLSETELTVNDIPDEHTADELEEELYSIID